MKTYRIALNAVGVVFVEADRHELEGEMIRFYRSDSVIAEYARASVRDITEPGSTPNVSLFQSGRETRES